MHRYTITLSLSLLFTLGLAAQSLFRPLPKLQPAKYYRAILPALPTDSSFVGFRFTGPTVLYVLPNSGIFTGAGLSYEHDTYKAVTDKWYTDWSIALEGYAGGQFAPKEVTAVTAVGLTFSFFNKLLTVGILYNLTTRQVAAGIGPTVSLNN